MDTDIYKQPLYYEIAFSFVDQKKQVDLYEKFIQQYSQVSVKSVLDIGCGTALQLREFARRGYRSIGLDLNKEMLDFLEEKTKEENIKLRTLAADMTNFKFNQKVDFAYILMGSIIYVKSNQDFLNHLDSVATSLNKGGLYLIENLPMEWDKPKFYQPQTWTMEQDGIKVDAVYKVTVKDAIKQIITQTISLKVNDNGKLAVFEDVDDLKLIFPQEFLALVDLNGKFEFVGWFERNSTKPLPKSSADNVAILRRK